MKTLEILAILLLSYGLSLAQPSSSSPPAPKKSDAEQLVAIVLADNASTPIYGDGFVRTLLNRMGDKAALAVFQYLGERQPSVAVDSTTSQELRMILFIIRESFGFPSIIDSEENRSPKATMVRLKYLSTLPAARLESQDFEQTIEFVERTKLAAQAAR